MNMSQLAMSHPNGGLRISPQSFPQPSHMQVGIPTTSSASAISMISQPHTTSALGSPRRIQSPILGSPSPSDKKQIDAETRDEERAKDGSALNMTISPSTTANPASSSPITGDIRTNSITALRIKAKEHLENINKNLTMV